MLLNNLSFMSNQGNQYGGAIYIYYSGNISIKNCIFSHNTATFGGAVYYNDDLETKKSYFLLKNNVFINNHAFQSGGAVMLYEETPKYISNNTYISNNADSYGDNYASEPIRVLFFKDKLEIFDNISKKPLENPFFSLKIEPGSQLPHVLSFVFIDIFYQKVIRNYEK